MGAWLAFKDQGLNFALSLFFKFGGRIVFIHNDSDERKPVILLALMFGHFIKIFL